MAVTLDTVEVSGAPGEYHIPGVHNMQATLCGHVDPEWSKVHEACDFPCNCTACINALKAIKALRFSKNYFEEN